MVIWRRTARLFVVIVIVHMYRPACAFLTFHQLFHLHLKTNKSAVNKSFPLGFSEQWYWLQSQKVFCRGLSIPQTRVCHIMWLNLCHEAFGCCCCTCYAVHHVGRSSLLLGILNSSSHITVYLKKLVCLKRTVWHFITGLTRSFVFVKKNGG